MKISQRIALLQIFIVLHCIEEYFFGFSDWATRHFGTTTQTWYFLSHYVLAIFFVLILVATYRGIRWGLFLSLAMQTLVFTNGLFHIIMALRWNEYSPGIIAQIVIVPMTIAIYWSFFHFKLLGVKSLIWSLLLGLFVSSLVIGSLYLDIPV